MTCTLCPHGCEIPPGGAGFCGARANRGGTLYAAGYGLVSACALDPVEKKPLRRFMPGGMILSLGGYGCNLRCPFCQNHGISFRAAMDEPPDAQRLTPRRVAELAEELIPQGNVGVAYTYNEPLIGYEFVRDCAALARERKLKNAAVTNGYINPEPLRSLLPYMDAFNIDLKAYSEAFYQNIRGGLEAVKQTIALAAERTHVEVTTLIIPGENDSDGELDALARFIGSVSPDIPLHLSRFFPRHRMADKPPTPTETMLRLKNVAEKYLTRVYLGNLGR